MADAGFIFAKGRGQNVYGNALQNFPALQRAAQQRLSQEEKAREFEERRSDTEVYRDRRLGLEERKETALEDYRAQALRLTEQARQLEGLRLQTEMGKAEFEMQKEMAQAKETMQQQQEMTKAIGELGKIDVKQPDYLDKIADIRSRFPNAFKQSKNGEESFIHGYVNQIYDERKEYMKGIGEARDKYGANLALDGKGNIDFKKTKENQDAEVAKESAGLGLTGMTETSHGTMRRYGQGADGGSITTQEQINPDTGKVESKVVTTKVKPGAPVAPAQTPTVMGDRQTMEQQNPPAATPPAQNQDALIQEYKAGPGANDPSGTGFNDWVKSRSATPTPTAAAPQLSAQDQAAISWANANPNDPRASKIKQIHGIQ